VADERERRVLQELFDVRTNGTGYVNSQWDDTLLLRDLKQLEHEQLIEEITKPFVHMTGLRHRWFREVGSGDVFEYVEGWERGSPKFRKLT
jgi:hypothetical protein